MILLTTTDDSLTLTTNSADDIHYTVNYVDISSTAFTPGSSQGTISSATTTTVVSAPSSGVKRQLKYLSFFNADSGNNTLIVNKKVSATEYKINTVELEPGQTLEYIDSSGFAIFPTGTSGIEYTDEMAQDAIGVMVGTSLVYDDAGPTLKRAALTGDVTASEDDNALTIANDAVTYDKIQNISATNKLLGRSTSGAGNVEEITCTAAGRAIIDDADATAQRATLGLGTLATQSGTFSGTSFGTNTGDQTNLSVISDTKANFDMACNDGDFVFQSGPLGTPSGGTLTNCTGLPVAGGGTGRATATSYAIVLGGTTSTGAYQSMASGSAGQIAQSAGNAAVPVWSTPTYPSASGAARKMLVSDGTNNIYSTETWPVPGALGNILKSDGTNWTSAANTSSGIDYISYTYFGGL